MPKYLPMLLFCKYILKVRDSMEDSPLKSWSAELADVFVEVNLARTSVIVMCSFIACISNILLNDWSSPNLWFFSLCNNIFFMHWTFIHINHFHSSKRLKGITIQEFLVYSKFLSSLLYIATKSNPEIELRFILR